MPGRLWAKQLWVWNIVGTRCPPLGRTEFQTVQNHETRPAVGQFLSVKPSKPNTDMHMCPVCRQQLFGTASRWSRVWVGFQALNNRFGSNTTVPSLFISSYSRHYCHENPPEAPAWLTGRSWEYPDPQGTYRGFGSDFEWIWQVQDANFSDIAPDENFQRYRLRSVFFYFFNYI